MAVISVVRDAVAAERPTYIWYPSWIIKGRVPADSAIVAQAAYSASYAGPSKRGNDAKSVNRAVELIILYNSAGDDSHTAPIAIIDHVLKSLIALTKSLVCRIAYVVIKFATRRQRVSVIGRASYGISSCFLCALVSHPPCLRYPLS